jgi:hypothetical protein
MTTIYIIFIDSNFEATAHSYLPLVKIKVAEKAEAW